MRTRSGKNLTFAMQMFAYYAQQKVLKGVEMIDNSGRLFGKVSLLDIFVILAIIALFLGFFYSQMSEQVGVFVSPTEQFYVTFEANGLRPVNAATLEVGNIVFRRHDNEPLGIVTHIEPIVPATYLLARSDGTVVAAEMEGRYRLVFTVRSRGSITSIGYFVNGNDHIAVGSIITVVSYRTNLPELVVIGIR